MGSAPLNLADLQQKFSSHLLNSDEDLSELGISGPFAATQLMQVYRNNFYISLTEYLLACFPVVEALVGEEFFAQLSKAFIRETALETATIEHYGYYFPPFISHCEQTKSLPYLADVARLEWAVERAKTVVDIPSFPFLALEQLTQEEQASLCFKLVDQCALIRSDYPVAAIWNGVNDNNLEGINMDCAESVVVYPQALKGMHLEVISAQQFDFLLAIQSGNSVADLVQFPDLQQELGFFIGQGIINSFYLSSLEKSK